MLEVIEKLLILQDRDRKLIRVRGELAHIPHDRAALQNRSGGAQKALDDAKLKVKELESKRKQLELEVDTKKGQIEKYSVQQFQTKKNDEFKALGNEIEHAKAAIVKIEDQELEIMEQSEAAQKQMVVATQASNEAKKVTDGQLAELAKREENVKKELAELESNRSELAGAVEETVLVRYERLLKNKGENVIVGIEHSVCGGCHMKLSRQTMLTCRQDQEIVPCPQCGRILYYTRDMDLANTD